MIQNKKSDPSPRAFSMWRGKSLVMAVVAIAVVAMTAAFVREMRREAQWGLCQGRLGQISLALNNYKAHYGEYPPCVLHDENGQALHSWRMLIFPFLVESDEISGQFRLSEPWNSEHNLRVAKSLPQYYHDVFGSPTDNREHPQWTSFVAVRRSTNRTGAEPVIQSEKQARREIVIIEVRRSGIHWMEPRDLSSEEIEHRWIGRSLSGDCVSFVTSTGDVGTFCGNAIMFYGSAADLLGEWLPQ